MDKPTQVSVGQRWRAPGAPPYTVDDVCQYPDGTVAVYVIGDGWTAGPWLPRTVLADEYLGVDDGLLGDSAGREVMTSGYVSRATAEVCPRCQRPRRVAADGTCCWHTRGPYCYPAADWKRP